jgi:tetratricopeptide (TPR) repeat protein
LEGWNDALTQARTALDKRPGDPEATQIAAAALHGRGASREGLDTLTPVLAAGGGDAAIHSTQGDILSRLGRDTEAEHAYRTALKQNPHWPPALIGLATFLAKHGKLDQAGELLAQAKAREPGRPRVRLAMATLLVTQNKLDEALRELKELPAQAWSPRVALMAGELYVRTKRYEEAVQVLEPLTQRFPRIAPAHFALGHGLMGVNRPEQAVAAFQEVVRLEPDNPLSRFGLAHAYIRVGRAREALAELASVAKALDQQPDYHLQLGRAHLVLAQYDEAIRAGERALRLAPQSPQPYAVLGAVYMRRGDLRRAQEMYARAVAVDPNFAGGHIALGHVFGLEQKPEEALDLLFVMLRACRAQAFDAFRLKSIFCASRCSTGLPFSIFGLNFQRMTACTAAASKMPRGLASMTLALRTVPSAFTSTSS